MACVVRWDSEDVALWLEQCLQLPYGNVFREAGIDGMRLVDLDEQRLKELGVTQSAHLLRLLSHITVFRTQLGRSMIMPEDHSMVPQPKGTEARAPARLLSQSSTETAAPSALAHARSESSAADSDAGGSTGALHTAAAGPASATAPRSTQLLAPLACPGPAGARSEVGASSEGADAGGHDMAPPLTGRGARSQPVISGQSSTSPAPDNRPETAGRPRSRSASGRSGADPSTFARLHAARASEPWAGQLSARSPRTARQGDEEKVEAPSSSSARARRSLSEPPTKKASPGAQPTTGSAGDAARGRVPALAMAKAKAASDPSAARAASARGPCSGRQRSVGNISARSASQRSTTSRLSTSRLSEGVHSEFGHSSSRGAFISHSARKLHGEPTVQSPGPGSYEPAKSQESSNVRGKAHSGTKFPKADRLTDCSYFVVGQASPGVAKYTPLQRRPPPAGGRIGGAPRWKSDSGFNGLPQRIPEKSPGPTQYVPKHSYSSRFK
mmetsp:Transcript_30060/g.70062  ORF Transcript_30060/g.70062 Transcript_30060/m.70062 type:complete len:499 (-) Transcript_30060:221-1717(-)